MTRQEYLKNNGFICEFKDQIIRIKKYLMDGMDELSFAVILFISTDTDEYSISLESFTDLDQKLINWIQASFNEAMRDEKKYEEFIKEVGPNDLFKSDRCRKA